MPCYEYKPKRIVVELDEREYEEFVETCKWIFKANGFSYDDKPDSRGVCISILIQMINKGD